MCDLFSMQEGFSTGREKTDTSPPRVSAIDALEHPHIRYTDTCIHSQTHLSTTTKLPLLLLLLFFPRLRIMHVYVLYSICIVCFNGCLSRLRLFGPGRQSCSSYVRLCFRLFECVSSERKIPTLPSQTRDAVGYA